MLQIIFKPEAWEQYVNWQSEDKKTLKRINELIKSIVRTPFEGIGKPEPLRSELSGYWSRRIDSTNRLVYKITFDSLVIYTCKTHYE